MAEETEEIVGDEDNIIVDFFGGTNGLEDAILPAGELEGDSDPPSPAYDEPRMSDPGWSDFVLSHFVEGELDREGRPLVHGLRRVVRLLLGPIIRSKCKTVQAPSLLGGFNKTTLLQPAVVEYTVEILMCRLESGMSQAYPVEVGDVADVYFGNTDPDFARHASASAATKAEARCLRKLLQLRKAASEEMTYVALPNASVNGLITPEQINFIDVLCARNNIDVLKYINSGKGKYNSIDEVPFGAAALMVEYLSGYQNNQSSIPEKVKGYKKGWNA